MDPFTATGLAGLSGPSRLGDSFFLECYCVVLHYRYARLCTAQAPPHQEPLVSRCKMSNESTVLQAASTAPRCRDQPEARAHAGRAHGWMGGRLGWDSGSSLPPLLCFSPGDHVCDLAFGMGRGGVMVVVVPTQAG